MNLRLTSSDFTWIPCPECHGLGKIPCPPTLAVRTGVQGCNHNGPINTPSTGKPIPCPTCNGKKVVTR